MSKRVHLSDMKGDDDYDLRILLEKFIKKSEELEKRESEVLKQVELVQSAVASLQAWKQGVKPPTPARPPDPLRIDVKKIEEETREIREETERIQREVRQKIEDNKRLQEEIDRRNTLLSDQVDLFVTDSFFRTQEEARPKQMERKEIESRPIRASGYPEFTYDPGIDFFNEKLDRLKQLEKKVKKELEQESEEARKKRKTLSEKIDLLERDFHVDWSLGSSFGKRTASSK